MNNVYKKCFDSNKIFFDLLKVHKTTAKFLKKATI